MSLAAWLLFTGEHALRVVLQVRCPWPFGSCSPVCLPWCAVSCVRCPGPVGSGPPVCTLGVRCCVCGVLGPMAPVHRCACSLCCVVCAVFWASWLLSSGVPAPCAVSCVWSPGPCRCAPVVCVVLCVWCPGLFGSCSPVLRCVAVCVAFGVRCCVCGDLGRPAPVHRCARPVCGVVWAVSWVAWLLFTGVCVRCVVWCVRCLGHRGPCSPVCALGVWCFVFGVLGLLAPVHQCACGVCCMVCAVFRATRLPLTGVPAWRVLCCVFGVLGLVAPVHRRAVCLFGVLCVVCGVLGHVVPVHRCACPLCCVVCVAWVRVCARVCHTVLVAFFVTPESRRRRCTSLGFLCAFMSYAIWSLRCGLLVSGDAQE